MKHHRTGRKRFHHPIVGDLDLSFEALELPADPGLRINVYTGGSSLSADVELFIFGIASIAGIITTGALLDRHPRPLLHGSAALFIAATVLRGITFGGVAAQLQAALTTTGGADSDVANSFLPVAFNLAIFTAGILGAALLTNFSGLVLAVVMIVAGLAALMLTLCGRRTAFPARL